MTTTAAVEWKIAIEGTNAFGEVRRHEFRLDKGWDRLFDGEIGLSVEDGKKIMAALQAAVVSQEADAYTLFRRVCPDCGVLRPVKDYTTRRIRTVFGTVEVRNPRWMLCRDCHPGLAFAFAPLLEICPDRATSELIELTARLGSMMPYRQAASVMANFLPIEPTETHATSVSAPFAQVRDSTAWRLRRREQRRCGRKIDASSSSNSQAIAVGSSRSASIPRTFGARIRKRRAISNSLWPDAAVGVEERPAAAISSLPAPINMLCVIERFTRSGEKDIAGLATSP